MNPCLQNIYQHPSFSEQDLEKIAKQHQKIELKKGDFFLKEGEISDAYFILENGVARSFVYDLNANDITTNFFASGEIVIEVLSIFQRIPTMENIQAETDCIAWRINYDDFQDLFLSIPALTEWGRAWMSFQLFSLKQRSVEMITQSATQRYLNLMEEKSDVLKYVPLKNIATYLGVTDSSLSRIRKDLVSRPK